jgi:hypothetical protein
VLERALLWFAVNGLGLRGLCRCWASDADRRPDYRDVAGCASKWLHPCVLTGLVCSVVGFLHKHTTLLQDPSNQQQRCFGYGTS